MSHELSQKALDQARGASRLQYWFFVLSSRRKAAKVLEAHISRQLADVAAKAVGGVVSGGYVFGHLAVKQYQR